MTAELLPCPFCHQSQFVLRGVIQQDTDVGELAYCSTCRATAPIEIWQNRAMRPASAEGNGEVTEAEVGKRQLEMLKKDLDSTEFREGRMTINIARDLLALGWRKGRQP